MGIGACFFISLLGGSGLIHAELPAVSTETAPTPSPLPFQIHNLSTTPYHMDMSTTLPIFLPPFEFKAFDVGEELSFEIGYEFVNAGKADLKLEEGPVVDGRHTININSNARTNDFFDHIFKVRDFNGSRVDKESFASINFHQNLREGKYKVIRNTAIDYKSGKYFFEKKYKGKTRTEEGFISRPVLDILATLYYVRTLPLERGKEYLIEVFSDDGVHPLKVVVHSKTHKVKVPAGEFKCIRVAPYIMGDAIFKARGGKMHIWLTDDERKMPVLLSSQVMIGSFEAKLVKYKPPLK